MRPGDEPFVYRAWLEGYWPHFPGGVVMAKGEYMQRYHRVIERILADARTRAMVAHVASEPDLLLGFAVGAADCLHWCYVKHAFRRLGVARALIAATTPDKARCSHYSDKLPLWEGWEDPEGSTWWTFTPEQLKEYGGS
jgi:GNAT superfamily N-acetyltransferase